MPSVGLIFHTMAQLRGPRQGLLVDIGAFDNLCGDAWLERVDKLARIAGLQVERLKARGGVRGEA